MKEQVAITQIQAGTFTLDIAILDDGTRVVPENEVIKFLKALEMGELDVWQVEKIKRDIEAVNLKV